ncbi:MAG: hypothetical protein HPY53_11645 [Brevinematales bacterium]|nr:hypothetical protein [Brevinematales bacterium]
MKRLLGAVFLIAVMTVFVQAKYYSYQPAAMMIDIPSGWTTEEMTDNGDYLKVSSPNAEVLIYLKYYYDGGWGSYTAEEEYGFLTSYFSQFLNQESLVISEQFEENINGMKVYAISGDYDSPDYGKAYVYCGAFETGKQLSALMVDVLESDMKNFKDAVNKIIDSAKKIK